MNNLNIIIILSDQLPENFRPNYDDFTKRGLKFFKVTDTPEKQDFPFNSKLDNWNIEIIYDDYKCIAGRTVFPTKDIETITSDIKGEVQQMKLNCI